MRVPVYLDNHATTPLDPRVFEIMRPYFTEIFGNAASRSHAFGWQAEEAVEKARRQIAALINANPKEIIFTSGATESNNLALKGVAESAGAASHIVSTAIEHKSILDTLKHLEKQGVAVSYLPVERDGLVDPEKFRAAINEKTALATVMYANNEIGVIQNIRDLGAIAKQHNVLFHTDAAQALGKIPIDVIADHIDLLSLTAHKIYGPKGAGALYVRSRDPRVSLTSQMDGGGHERGLRSGTLNVPGIAGLGAACAIAQSEMQEESKRLASLRDRLKDRILAGLDQVHVNGSLDHRLPNNLNLSFAYVDSESLLLGVNDVALSSGSACTSATLEPSYVLKALGAPDDIAHSSIRFGLGRFTTEEEIDYTARRIIEVVTKLRELSPLWELHNQSPAAQ
jgi:cysteine desulfurase